MTAIENPLENEWVAHVDRGRIERWMASEDEKPEDFECDEWDSKTVDISNSVSAVADSPKSRRRIDHWRSICERLDVEMIDEASPVCRPDDRFLDYFIRQMCYGVFI
jgi:hypothetical protein